MEVWSGVILCACAQVCYRRYEILKKVEVEYSTFLGTPHFEKVEVWSGVSRYVIAILKKVEVESEYSTFLGTPF